MALRIYNNISSLNAQRYLGITNSQMSKSLERLSSGLRINHASDDASGLAISEKLRGQISGLKRASMNAQDGISMLQTAEGGLQEVQNIVQRMRELAVQASNGTLTSNDRLEIQKEFDQLKTEITRITSSTEFNTKKLLNGDSSALWSANSNKIDAIVTGTPVEGNFKIQVKASPGKNYQYDTNVMTLKDGAQAAEITTNDVAARSITDVSGLNSTINDNTKEYTVNFSKTDLSTSDVGSAVGTYYTDSTRTGINNIEFTGTVTTDANYFAEIEMLQNWSGDTTDINAVARIRFYSVTAGTTTDWYTVNYSGSNTDIVVSVSSSLNFKLDAANLKFSEGDKALLWIANSGAVDASATSNAHVKFTDSFSNESEFDLAGLSSSSEYKKNTFYIAEIDPSNGTINYGQFTIEMGKTSDVLEGDLKFDVAGPGDRATESTYLKDIANFITDDGRNLFDTTQSLTIYGNGKSTTIYLEGNDTVKDFEDKLTNALVNDLGMGSNNTDVNNNLVRFVTQEPSNTGDPIAGTFHIQTALLGDDSELSFIGDQKLLDALSINVTQKGENSTLSVTVTDTNTGQTVGTDSVNDFTLKGVIQGLDIKLSSNINIDVTASGNDINFNASSTEEVYLHVVNNSTELQIGANQGQTIDVSISQVDTKALGLDDLTLVSQEKAQFAVTKIDKALEKLSDVRATIGAQINRLEHAITNLDTARENLTASESRIRDLDIAEEMAQFTRYQILQQSSTAMLAQANQLPQLALQLLGR